MCYNATLKHMGDIMHDMEGPPSPMQSPTQWLNL